MPSDNLPADYAERELSFATSLFQAELLGVSVRDPGRDQPLEVFMHHPETGVWGLVRISDPKRMMALAEAFLKAAGWRL